MSGFECTGWFIASALGGFMFALFLIAARMETCDCCGKQFDKKAHPNGKCVRNQDAPRSGT